MSANPTCPRCHRGGKRVTCDVPSVEMYHCTFRPCDVDTFTIEDGHHEVYLTEDEMDLQLDAHSDD